MRRLILVIALLLVGAGHLPEAFAQSLVVIAHPTVAVDTLDSETLERIWLGKRTRWEDGSAIEPVMLNGGRVHELFCENYLNRTESQFMTYWRQAVFTGRGVPPRSFASEVEMLEYVASTPGAIGYLASATPGTGVKLIRVQ